MKNFPPLPSTQFLPLFLAYLSRILLYINQIKIQIFFLSSFYTKGSLFSILCYLYLGDLSMSIHRCGYICNTCKQVAVHGILPTECVFKLVFLQIWLVKNGICVIWIYIDLTQNDDECYFTCFRVMCISCFLKCVLCSFISSIGWLVFFLLISRIPLYAREISTSSRTRVSFCF